MDAGILESRLDDMLMGDEQEKDAKDDKEKAKSAKEDLDLFLQVGIKFSDLGHSIKPWPLHEEWSLKVTKEFYTLGDYERSINLPISPLCDREKDTNLPKSQQGFLNFVILPYYQAVARILPVRRHVLKNLSENVEGWTRQMEGRLSVVAHDS
eukprot:6645308-Prymnesium_polylepis.1